MSDDGAREDACREYQSSLEDLTFNSKPHINMLTILAEENIQFTKDIVAIIEAQIAKAPPVEKLPVLYLVDSIVKNVGGAYLEVFAKNLVNSFICVFEKVDEGTRKSLFKLRSTWDEIFPLEKLYALDVRVNSVDPAWPIKPLPPNVNASIHVNPKFLKPTEETPPKPTPPPPTPSLTQEQLIRQQLLAKQKQLLELQQKKIELELEQTKAQLAASPSLALNHHASAPVRFNASPKVNPTVPVPQTKSWPPAPSEKLSTRDPRLNRSGTTAVNPKEQVTHKKESPAASSFQNAPEKRGQASSERPAKLDKLRIPKKDNSAVEEKSKSKSMLPSGKVMPVRPRGLESEQSKSAEVNKKDPRLHKQMHERMDSKDEDVREKKRSSEKKDRDEGSKNVDHQKLSSNRGKLINGSVNKHEKLETFLKQEIKVNKANVRKRSRSRSPPVHSPKRKERRSSPKRKTRSISPPSKSGKSRLSKHPHDDAFPQSSARDERTKKLKYLKVGKRWRSGWKKKKHPKHSDKDLSDGGMGIQKHKTWIIIRRPPTPRKRDHFYWYKNPLAPFDGPSSHMREPRLDGPPRPFVPPPRYESSTGGFDGSGGPVRFSGHHFDTPHHSKQFPKAPEIPVRFNNPQVSHRPMRFVEPHNVRFDSPTPVHYDHSMPQNRFANPPRFDNPQMQQGPPGYEEPHFPARIINYDEQQGPVRFDNPTCGIRFENPVQPEPLRFDAPPVMPRYDPQGPPRYCGPNIPNQLRPQEPTMYDQTQGQGPMINPTVPPPNFNIGGPAQQFSTQPNVSQTSNFSVPVPTSSDFQGSFRPPFPGPGVGGVPQPMMGAQNFMPQNPMPFQPVSQFPQPEPEPLRQIDVNDLMSKLISTGIIKPAPTDSTADLPMEEQLRRLQKERTCKVCMDKEVNIVFIPCGHLVVCEECASSLLECPICRGMVEGEVRTFFS